MQSLAGGNIIGYQDAQQELLIYRQRVKVVQELLAVDCPDYNKELVPDSPVHIEVMKWIYKQLVETLIDCRKVTTAVTTSTSTTPATPYYRDCQELFELGLNVSGVYEINPGHSLATTFKVWCDFVDSHGWTVIQRRGNKSVTFDRNWEEYKNGFGDIEGEHWIGNEKIHILTLTNQQLNIHLRAASGKESDGVWQRFFIADEADHFRLTIDEHSHSGDLQDTFSSYHNGMMFTAGNSDNDLDSDNCAKMWNGKI
ncbi:ryncolin-2-like [Watersipora subatra]|uniref:ryncolin-2-like n=1 Tax=Watersipora subatra TaxID=2589382 RepID=UPI00355B9C42